MDGGPRRPGRPRRNVTDPPRHDDDRWDEFMQVIRDKTKVIRDQTIILNNLVNLYAQTGGPAQPPPPPPETANRAFFQFLKLNPPTFSGGQNAMEAQYWLEAMEKIFIIVQCTEEKKVTFATYMLKGASENWWKGAEAHLLAVGTPIDWEHFQIAFLDRYFPTTIRKKKEREFTQLQQGNMSVAEYVAKFEELARYSYHARYAPDEEWKIDQFEWGLRADIRNILAQTRFTEYATLVQQTYVAEESLKDMEEERQRKWPKNRNEGKYSQQLKARGILNKGKQVQTSSSPRMMGCPRCGKSHKGECLVSLNICFICKQPNHLSRSCSNLKQKGVAIPGNQTSRRVFTINGKAKGSDSLITAKEELGPGGYNWRNGQKTHGWWEFSAREVVESD